jgi:uncharacterized protein
VFTHGYGFVAAYGNRTSTTQSGAPAFFEQNIPPQGLLDISQPRVYFGESSPDYSIVGGPPGRAPVEYDYPNNTSAGQANNTYDGKGGVPMGSLFGRLLFATKFGEPNILLSDRINSDSKILWNRTPRQRVEAVAPWLTVDGDTYPAVVEGRIVWIVDGYTTSNGYPYSERTTLGQATSDSLTATSSNVVAQQSDQVNYIRNSVKAVVDAYDGTVTLYAWDQSTNPDPVLAMWRQAFPGTVKDESDIPPSLLVHLRYPQDLFKVQRELYAKYHVVDPRAFYGGQDFWKVPDDPTTSGVGSQAQPPYYLTLQMPGEQEATFSITSTLTPNNRENLAAFMAVDSDPGPDYGTIRVLRLPRSTNVPGPGQVQNNFESDATISPILSLLRQRGSQVVYGNLLSLPVGGGLLYVEPVYVTAAAGTNYPLLRYVLTSFGNTVAMGDTLQQSLAGVFLGTTVTTPGGTGTTPPPGGTTTTPSGNAALKQALADAQKALADSQAALRAGDFAAYGAAQKALADAIARAVAAANAKPTTASPSPSASPAASS